MSLCLQPQTSIDSIENLIEELGSISFDAHFTAKTMQFGKLLTGIPLCTHIKMIAYRIICMRYLL
jgi:hypothetical protein